MLTLTEEGGGRAPIDVGGRVNDGDEELFTLLD